MDTEQILKIINDVRDQGERAGLRQAIGIVQSFLAALDNPAINNYPPESVAARKDQLEKVLSLLIERAKEI